MGAVHLYGRFRDADIVGDLLVQAAGRDLNHDLTLAGTERAKTLPECTQSAITLPTGSITSESGLNSIKEILIAEWFGKKLYGAALHCLDAHRHVGMRCHEDDRDLPIRRDQFALKLETALPR